MAALVGLFATDSVERHVIDYTQGSLSVAMASCSMLGLLGHVRALLKLGLGSRACEAAAFPTAALRPIFGAAIRDRIPPTELRRVNYIQWRETSKYEEWNLVKQMMHTDESMPWGAPAEERHRARHLFIQSNPIHIAYFSRVEPGLRNPVFLLRHLVVQSLITGVTVFVVVPFTKGNSVTKWFGTVGLFASIVTPSTMWAWHYAQESIEHYGNETQGESTQARQSLAFVHSGSEIGYFRANAVLGFSKRLISSVSIVFALTAAAGYICQYIEVRKASAVETAYWLIVQAILALCRILYWVFRPHVWPKYQQRRYDISRQRVLLNRSFHEVELIAIWSSLQYNFQNDHIYTFRIPRSIEKGFFEDARVDNNKTKVHQLDMETAFRLFFRAQAYPNDPVVARCLQEGQWWQMPQYIFHRWLDMRIGNSTKTDFEIGCQVIKYNDEFHLWPGIYVNNAVCINDSCWYKVFFVQYNREDVMASLASIQLNSEGGCSYLESTEPSSRIRPLSWSLEIFQRIHVSEHFMTIWQDGPAPNDSEDQSRLFAHVDKLKKSILQLLSSLGVYEGVRDDINFSETAGLDTENLSEKFINWTRPKEN
jgi:hypothetical protein